VNQRRFILKEKRNNSCFTAAAYKKS